MTEHEWPTPEALRPIRERCPHCGTMWDTHREKSQPCVPRRGEAPIARARPSSGVEDYDAIRERMIQIKQYETDAMRQGGGS